MGESQGSQWTIDTVKEHVLEIMDERDHRYEQRFQSQKLEVDTARVDMNKRLEGMNEFRSSMQDMQKLFATREEVSRLDEAQKPFVTRAEMISFCVLISAIVSMVILLLRK